MCNECGKEFCAHSCPLFVGRGSGKGQARGTCSACGKLIYTTDLYFRKSERLVCGECLASPAVSASPFLL